MTITQTVEIPPSRWLNIEVPREVPTGTVILTWQSPLEKPAHPSMQRQGPRTVEEALQIAKEQAVDPNRKPISRHFGKHKGIFGGDGVAYQRAVRDEWD